MAKISKVLISEAKHSFRFWTARLERDLYGGRHPEATYESRGKQADVLGISGRTSKRSADGLTNYARRMAAHPAMQSSSATSCQRCAATRPAHLVTPLRGLILNRTGGAERSIRASGKSTGGLAGEAPHTV